MPSRAEHYKACEKILEALTMEKDSEWAKATATVALAHATLANAPWEMEDRS